MYEVELNITINNSYSSLIVYNKRVFIGYVSPVILLITKTDRIFVGVQIGIRLSHILVVTFWTC